MPEPETPLAERPWENVARLLDVDAALQLILAAFAPLPATQAGLLDAPGLVLAEDVVARNNVPPFRNSAMDGYAVHAADTAGSDWGRPISLAVVGEIAAGEAATLGIGPGEAIRIMTGAPLPAGANAVVRFEETDEATGGRPDRRQVKVFHPARALDNVREAGEDIQSGSVVVRKGRMIAAADVGLMASVGVSSVSVHRQPEVAILSTGNEIVEPTEPLTTGKIRNSNAYVLAAMARAWGARVRLLGIARDDVDELTRRLNDAARSDLIITSGGVSLGDFDFVKDVLRDQGEVAIWQVRMKPGKPLAFGRIGDTPLLGLPGNPVAAAVSFLLFGRPAIRTMLGDRRHRAREVNVIAVEAIDNRGQRRHFVRVTLEPGNDGQLLAKPVGEQGAGVLSSLAAADALMVVPEDLERVAAGSRLKALLIDW